MSGRDPLTHTHDCLCSGCSANLQAHLNKTSFGPDNVSPLVGAVHFRTFHPSHKAGWRVDSDGKCRFAPMHARRTVWHSNRLKTLTRGSSARGAMRCGAPFRTHGLRFISAQHTLLYRLAYRASRDAIEFFSRQFAGRLVDVSSVTKHGHDVCSFHADSTTAWMQPMQTDVEGSWGSSASNSKWDPILHRIPSGRVCGRGQLVTCMHLAGRHHRDHKHRRLRSYRPSRPWYRRSRRKS